MDSVTSLVGRHHAASAQAPHARGRSPVGGDQQDSGAELAQGSAKADPRSATEIVGHRTTESSTDAEPPTRAQLINTQLITKAQLSGQQSAEQKQQQIEEQQQVRELSDRDREVRAHEQAHASAGGQFTGTPNFQYQRGPNGVNYAVGGHVSIDASVVDGNPRATLQKAEVIRRAALAPAEPSAQDRSVAARASQMVLKAQAELAEQSRTYDTSEEETSSRVREGSKGAFVDISV